MTENRALEGSAQTLRPRQVTERTCAEVADWLAEVGLEAQLVQASARPITGITMDSREVQPGDLYVALGGAKVHGAAFLPAAIELGASALLTDAAGLEIVRELGLPEGLGVVTTDQVRAAVGPLSARIYASQPSSGGAPRLFAVTGTNGKTTTTYMTNSIMQALGHTTGLIGTIEILAGGQAIPSKLTTPESPHVHSLIALMREQGITSAAMEVSSHALDYRRVDGIRYDIAGFTNLTQDHLDLHGTMESYFDSKAELFTPARTRRAVITADDRWGLAMAERAVQALGARAVVRLFTNFGAGYEPGADALTSLAAQDWALVQVERSGIGHSFTLHRGDGFELPSATLLPADFNVSNAALAAVMVFESARDGLERDRIVEALSRTETLTPVVPGRMQLISTEPTALVDFAHNPDALKRALEAIEPAEEGGKVIIVFGATGERDQTKRPLMGEIAATYADIVVVTDDDPHGEDPAPIREAVEAGARTACEAGARAYRVLNIEPRAAAIDEAIALAGPKDSILVAGRGHEVAQDVAGTDIDLDDRVETARALQAAGFSVLPAYQNHQK
ncbi:UDP-N-acetylmuramoyl-L-alanyl-D-glutamate--2,6-diaminopimelate ligase [Rothia nasimurium]|uniref:UDP-N-acetylmuramoyl-L-alanyl-D-glutamate--2, 6-diaminopimelate ligase n=1 Tax=Rothia nasimurium TaxID=85336 RepID=UPI001F02B660|nr:UDP-N-acetylmuramoyl-L-alanyl-D-glutamate--2,6-diaminopimelate ligase [Rothia nasimurium]